MRKLLMAGAALALLAPIALAHAQQNAPAPGAVPPPDQAAQAGDMPPPPPPPPGGRRGPGGPGGPGMMPPPPPPRGPHIRLERGDAALDINCGEAETLKSCADTANALLDKMATLPAAPAPAAGTAPTRTP